MSEMEKLEPCPLCGGEPNIIRRGGAFGVKCVAVRHLAHSYGATEAEAIAAWNRRSPPPSRRVTREEVAKVIDPFSWRWLTTPGQEHAYQDERDKSLAKADQILSLLALDREERGSSGSTRAASPNASGLGTADETPCQSEKARALEAIRNYLEFAKTSLICNGRWQNEAGYLTDAALYIEQASTLAHEIFSAGTPDEPIPTAGDAQRKSEESIGPRVLSLTCDGCPALHTEKWREPSGDGETYDTGTYARCTAADREMDSAYWSRLARVPEWCPAPPPPEAGEE